MCVFVLWWKGAECRILFAVIELGGAGGVPGGAPANCVVGTQIPAFLPLLSVTRRWRGTLMYRYSSVGLVVRVPSPSPFPPVQVGCHAESELFIHISVPEV